MVEGKSGKNKVNWVVPALAATIAAMGLYGVCQYKECKSAVKSLLEREVVQRCTNDYFPQQLADKINKAAQCLKETPYVVKVDYEDRTKEGREGYNLRYAFRGTIDSMIFEYVMEQSEEFFPERPEKYVFEGYGVPFMHYWALHGTSLTLLDINGRQIEYDIISRTVAVDDVVYKKQDTDLSARKTFDYVEKKENEIKALLWDYMPEIMNLVEKRPCVKSNIDDFLMNNK